MSEKSTGRIQSQQSDQTTESLPVIPKSYPTQTRTPIPSLDDLDPTFLICASASLAMPSVSPLSPPYLPLLAAVQADRRFFTDRSQTSYSQSQSSQGSKKKTSPQLDKWSKTKEPHEEVAVGKKSSRRTADTIVFLDNAGQRIEGGARGAGR